MKICPFINKYFFSFISTNLLGLKDKKLVMNKFVKNLKVKTTRK